MMRAQAEIQQLLADSVLLGALVIEWGYDVPFNKHEEFKNWLIINEAKIVAVCNQTDVSYRGTYAVSATSEKHSGLYRTIWSFKTLHGAGELQRRHAYRIASLPNLLTN